MIKSWGQTGSNQIIQYTTIYLHLRITSDWCHMMQFQFMSSKLRKSRLALKVYDSHVSNKHQNSNTLNSLFIAIYCV